MKRRAVWLCLAIVTVIGVGDYTIVAVTRPGAAGQVSSEVMPQEPNGPMFGTAAAKTGVTTSCGDPEVMAGTAMFHGTPLASCPGLVGLDPTPVVAAAVGETVYVQIDGETERDPAHPPSDWVAAQKPTFSVTPRRAATIYGWTITPRQAARIDVDVTGLLCTPVNMQTTQPKTCRLMVIDAR